jgi:hypothetical protein
MKMRCSDVVFEVGFGDEIFAAGVTWIPGYEIRDRGDVVGSTDKALTIMNGAYVHLQIGFFREGFGTARVCARYGFPVFDGTTRVLRLYMFLQFALAGTFSITKHTVGMFLLDMCL